MGPFKSSNSRESPSKNFHSPNSKVVEKTLSLSPKHDKLPLYMTKQDPPDLRKTNFQVSELKEKLDVLNLEMDLGKVGPFMNEKVKYNDAKNETIESFKSAMKNMNLTA